MRFDSNIARKGKGGHKTRPGPPRGAGLDSEGEEGWPILSTRRRRCSAFWPTRARIVWQAPSGVSTPPARSCFSPVPMSTRSSGRSGFPSWTSRRSTSGARPARPRSRSIATMRRGVYLEALPIVRRGDSLAIGGAGEIVEWVAHLRRFDENATLDRIADRGGVSDALIDRLALAIRRSHARAPLRDAARAAARTRAHYRAERRRFRRMARSVSAGERASAHPGVPASPSPSRDRRCWRAALSDTSAVATAICTCATSS